MGAPPHSAASQIAAGAAPKTPLRKAYVNDAGLRQSQTVSLAARHREFPQIASAALFSSLGRSKPGAEWRETAQIPATLAAAAGFFSRKMLLQCTPRQPA